MAEEGKVISYGVVGGYVNDAPPSEAGIGVDWDARALILAEQERAKANQGKSWQRKAATPMGISTEINWDGSATLHFGQNIIYLSQEDVADLAIKFAQAVQKQPAKSISRSSIF
jgi:hypothetical protein